jgi:hypothetical protein
MAHWIGAAILIVWMALLVALGAISVYAIVVIIFRFRRGRHSVPGAVRPGRRGA